MAVGFVVKKDHTFKWPVVIREPRDGGSFTELHVEVEYKILGEARQQAVLEEMSKGEADVNLVREVLVGWTKGFLDEKGEQLPYSVEGRDAVLDVPYAKSAISQAYFDAVAGRKVKRKN